MTRFVVDTSAVFHLATEEIDVPAGHRLLVTVGAELARSVEGIVATTSIDAPR